MNVANFLDSRNGLLLEARVLVSCGARRRQTPALERERKGGERACDAEGGTTREIVTTNPPKSGAGPSHTTASHGVERVR